ncbi:MAG: hypothetical protein RL711_519 [Bacteroidota bacterium]|jgi:hypothetical protein
MLTRQSDRLDLNATNLAHHEPKNTVIQNLMAAVLPYCNEMLRF